MLDNNLVHVGIADMKFDRSPKKLKTVLGSCVGICLYDPIKKIGAMSHIMLPEKHMVVQNLFKFADTAIPEMLKEFKQNDVKIKDLVAKIFGGAQIFFSNQNSVIPDIGKMNVEMVKKLLNSYKIPIIAEEVGGTKGRTIIFDLDDGKVICKQFAGEDRLY